MAIPSAGSALALSAIQTEFGGSNPISMSEYYAGGSNVPSGTTGDSGNIPSSGTIAMSQFYGSSNRPAINLVISSTTQNYNIFNNRGGTYVAGSSDITLTVQAIVGSAGTGQHAIATGSFASGDTLKIINNSQIVACGGAGAAGSANTAAGGAGAAGGQAIQLGFATTIQNNGGFIRGGGGGGGGGGAGKQVSVSQQKGGMSVTTTLFYGGGGGGGGAGQNGGAAGAGGAGSNGTGTNGQAGSISAAGSGGAGNTQGGNANAGGAGGAAGGFGAAGAAGAGGAGTVQGKNGNGSAGGAGGAAGKAINLAGNSLTWEDGNSNVQGAVS